MGLGPEDVGVDVREVRHIEEVFDQPQSRSAHLYPSAHNDTAIFFLRLDQAKDLVARRAEAGPQAIVPFSCRQSRSWASACVNFMHAYSIVRTASVDDVLAKKPSSYRIAADVSHNGDGVPFIERHDVGCFGHQTCLN
jgi:hypothetical protein